MQHRYIITMAQSCATLQVSANQTGKLNQSETCLSHLDCFHVNKQNHLRKLTQFATDLMNRCFLTFKQLQSIRSTINLCPT